MLPVVSYLQSPLVCLIRILHSHFLAVILLLAQTHMHSIIYHNIILYHIIYHYRLPISFPTLPRKTCWLRTLHHRQSHPAHRKLPMSRCVFVLQSTLSTARISLACIAVLVLLPIPPPSPREAGAEGPGSCSTSTRSLMLDRNMA